MILMLILALAGDPATCAMHAQHMAETKKADDATPAAPAHCPMHDEHKADAAAAADHASCMKHAEHAGSAASVHDHAACPMKGGHKTGAQEQPAEHAHSDHAMHGVDARGDQVMGFSHERTKHTFRLLADGGAIEVRAGDASDADSIAKIRSHLQEIAAEFARGTFSKPEAIHARVPDGVDTLKELAGAVRYQYEELERGGRVRITTTNARALDAVHAFLRFQIADHHTGDSGKIE